MRQVPHYLLIGNGRVASHIQQYFSYLNIFYTQWDRQQSHARLPHLISQATHILLLISDDAIDAFVDKYLRHTSAIKIHFSGSLVTTKAYGAHPLMTFSPHLYDLSQYHAIPFVLDHDAPEFAALLPGLPNQHIRLHTSLKSKYHAFCVLSGNFSCLLWQWFFNTLEHEFNIPSAIAHPYLQKQMQNLMTHPQQALTGPLVRGDDQTIEKNLAALQGSPLQQVYQSFVDCYLMRSKS